MADVYIALGSNVGDRAAHMRAAMLELEGLGTLAGVSRFYETAPVGFLDQGPFLNGAVHLVTPLPPAPLLAALLAIEAGRGRVRSQKNGPRTLDLDLLLYGSLVLETAGLTLPHPRLAERAFVLQPLCDLAPGLIHPVLGVPLGELLARLGRQDYRAVPIDAS